MDPRGKGSITSHASDKSSRSGSFDFEHDQDPDRDRRHDDAHRREVVVKIEPEAHVPVDLHAGGSHAANAPGTGGVAVGAWSRGPGRCRARRPRQAVGATASRSASRTGRRSRPRLRR